MKAGFGYSVSGGSVLAGAAVFAGSMAVYTGLFHLLHKGNQAERKEEKKQQRIRSDLERIMQEYNPAEHFGVTDSPHPKELQDGHISH